MGLYHDYADRTAKLIAEGVLRPGEKLLSVRQACKTHGISPITVTQAYHLLESRGLIEARPKSGYFVRARLGSKLPEPEMTHPVGGSTALEVSDFIFQILDSVRDPAIVPLGSSFPDARLYPLDKLGRFLAAAARHLDPLATVTDLPPGNDELRRQLALRYLAHGASVSPQEIVVTSGALEGLNLCLQALTRPGDLIAIESPTFYAGLQASERLGLKVIEIPSHPREGVSLDALADALCHHPIKACLFMLNFANPTGSCVSDENKRALVALLHRHQVPLIEDDVYAELYFGREAPLCSKAMDTDGLVLHVSSFSKCLAPGYRVGWVAAGRFAKQVQRQKYSTSLATAVPLQIALADYLKHGGFDNHLRQLRRQLAAQEVQLLAGIEGHFPGGIRLARPDGGYFLWLELPGQVDTLRLHEEALAHGISIAPGPIFSAKREFTNYLRLNFGHPTTPCQDQALATLGRLIKRQL
ncbi:PLP-dependent aminotransferase family protein [Thauera humireducens]|uniref:GntR family transcriptional regulator n=1 Tax=Thauera humireducens TaxID=1134435 RepID=A0A127K9L1_9RHOO|nr:PLP-dependent aminotransferase family protein [Thauera humireducens]AMO38612.1 GntR family transcriptional regulator [Thauera humireducens]